jgi:hypothetical protein
MEVYKWINELNKLKGMEKFPVKSLGVGVLGRYNSHIVDYVQENKRLLRTLGVFGNTPSMQPPHVTRMKIIPPMNTGPLNSMDTILADKVVLYKVVGPKKYQVVHEVQLSKRNPLTWVMDGLGLSKYAKRETDMLEELGFHKYSGVDSKSLLLTHLLSNAIGYPLGYYEGKGMALDNEKRPKMGLSSYLALSFLPGAPAYMIGKRIAYSNHRRPR